MSRKILVSAACQTDTITEALTLLLPSDRVEYIYIPQGEDRTEYIKKHLEDGIDVLITSNRVLLEESFRRRHPKIEILELPTIIFSSYHPDVVYATNPSNDTIRCLNSDYHSAIVLWAWKNSIQTDKCVSLFNRETFKRLGYLSSWNESVDGLKSRFERAGLDFGRFWRSVQRRGCFLHSINHPHLFPLSELAKQLAVRLGVKESVYSLPLDVLLTDHLSALRWPIYPEIGGLYGIEGMYMWKIRKAFYLSLNDYVTSAYKGYSESGYTREQISMYTQKYDEFNSVMCELAGQH